MNKQRRKEIKNIMQELRDAQSAMEIVLANEEEAFENMPESLQSSTRGVDSEEDIDVLNGSIDNLDVIIDNLSDL